MDSEPQTIILASDHNGTEVRRALRLELLLRGHEPVDIGPSIERKKVDYTEYAEKVAYAVNSNSYIKGILICGTGVGMSIAANRYLGVRASLVTSVEVARKTREHNDSNVLVLGAWQNTLEEHIDILAAWLGEPYGQGRHEPRVGSLGKPDGIVLVPGVFDILHLGHVELFKFAKLFGKVVVAVNSDRSFQKIHGFMPMNSEDVRMRMVAEVSSVDEVVLMDDETAARTIRDVGATVVVKGAEVPESEVRLIDAVPADVQVKLCPLDERFSATKIREAIKRGK